MIVFQRFLLLIAVTVTYAGCDSLQKKHDNPVMTAAPERVNPSKIDEETSLVDDDSSDPMQKEDDGSNITQVRAQLQKKNPWDDWKDDTAIFNSQVAATVNGVPILNGDVLDNRSAQLIGMREEMQKLASNPKLLQPGQQIPTPETYNNLRKYLISNSIEHFITKKLLVEHLKSGLKSEQVKMMDSHIDQQFAVEIEKLKSEMKVTNKTELELALNKKGTTLQNVKENFVLEQLSKECVGIKMEKPKPIERPDLITYYQAHIDDYALPARVKWQQIQVSAESKATPTKAEKDAARDKIRKALSELNRGVSFAKVAKKYSDGPTAKDGGDRDWLEAGNLADTKLEEKLFSMPVGKLSEIHEGPNSFNIVRVTEKQTAGRTPFKEVQDEIKLKLQTEQFQQLQQKFIQKLYATAVIDTHYSVQNLPVE